MQKEKEFLIQVLADHLNKRATDYDMVYIIEEQDKKKDDFEKECRGLFLK